MDYKVFFSRLAQNGRHSANAIRDFILPYPIGPAGAFQISRTARNASSELFF
jgi:hypothetical protein